MPEVFVGKVKTRRADRTDTLKERVGLRIGSLEWSAWSDVSIALGIEQAARSAAVSLSTVDWARMQCANIVPSKGCEIRLGQDIEPLITGFIDADELSLTEGSKLKIEVRSKTADLIDCSAIHPTGIFRGQKVESIARSLATFYGIEVVCDVDTGAPVPLFRCVPTESVFKAIERLCRERGLLLMDDGYGRLVITSIGDVPAAVAFLERGRNIKSMTRRRDVTQRYSEYRIRGQVWDDIGAQAVSLDEWLTRRRVLVLDSEKRAGQAAVEKRAKWEAATRAGQSIKFEVTVPGWRTDTSNPKSPIWLPGTIARLKDGVLGLDDDLLITKVNLTRTSRDGTNASLSLGYPEGYQPEPNKFKAGKKSKGSGADWDLEDGEGDDA